ncbi:MAG: glycosyltransferase family 4 protein [Chthonomonadales bacterium]
MTHSASSAPGQSSAPRNPLRILIPADVDPAEVIGGAERALSAEAAELARRGHHVTVLTRALDTGRPLQQELDGYRIVRFPAPTGKGLRALLSTASAARKAFETASDGNAPHLLYPQQPIVGAGVMQSRSAASIASVYMFHSPWSEEYRIRALERRAPLADPRFTRSTLMERINIELRRRVEASAVRRCSLARVMSTFMGNECRRIHNLPPHRIVRIPAGVDIRHFMPPADREALRSSLGIAREDVVLFTVRNLVPRMGLGNLLEAVARVVKQQPRVACIIGGTGPLEAALRTRAAELGLADRVRFTGFIPEADLPAYYGAADLFVLPTTALEGFGLVTVEAMACGTPAVGTPLAATPEILRGFDERLLLPGADPEPMAEGILQALDLAAGRPEWRSRARDYVEQNYAWPKVVDRLEELFYSLVGSAQ